MIYYTMCAPPLTALMCVWRKPIILRVLRVPDFEVPGESVANSSTGGRLSLSRVIVATNHDGCYSLISIDYNQRLGKLMQSLIIFSFSR